MKLDCTDSQSTANASACFQSLESHHLPKGKSDSEPDAPAGSEVEVYTQVSPHSLSKTAVVQGSCSSETAVLEKSLVHKHRTALQPTPWCYLFVHHKKVAAFEEQFRRDNLTFFIHTSIKYVHQRGNENHYKRIVYQTVSGLIFIKGRPREIQFYLDQHFPLHHLCRNCSTGQAAVIPNSQMEPFMRVATADPDRIRFLLRPFLYYSRNRTLLRIVSGDYAGLEGYVIRIARDRKLVMDVGGMSVAIGGVHNERFEEVDKNASSRRERATYYKRNLHERNAFVDRYFHQVRSPLDVAPQADNINLLLHQSLSDLREGRLDAKDTYDTLSFIIEEIGYYYAPVLDQLTTHLAPILQSGRSVMQELSRLIQHPQFSSDVRLRLQSELEELEANYGYLFE